MSRRRRHELAVAGQVISLAGAAWIQPVVAAGSLLALLLAPAARAGEVSATQGPLDLGTRVNGVAGGRCQGGQCEVTGGTAAGANLFHRFNRFDTRGEIRGVSIQNGVHSTVVLGVLDPMGSFLNKGISLSSPAHLFFLSPGGLQVGAGAQFFNTPRLTLSTASSLGLGSGRFEVFRTTAAEAALLAGMPIRGKGGLGSDPAEAQRNGLTSGGDLVVDGGLIQVDEELLLDAQGANLLLQAGSQLAAPGGSVELSGRNVTVAAGALVTTSAQAPVGPAPETTTAPGTTTAPAVAPVVPAPVAVATTAANSAAPALATAAANPSPTTIPAQTPAALVEAPVATATTATSAAPEPAVPVLTAAAANPASATPQSSALQAPAAVAGPLPETNPPAPAQISAAGLDGGVIRISASSDAVVAGQLKALGIAATVSGTTAASGSAASGTVASGGSGKGGRIEVTGQRVTLTAAALDASGPAGGGTVLLGGDVRGANPAVPNANSTTVDAASTVRADALAKGDGGTVVAYANQRTAVDGLLSVRGGPDGGNGGFVETSGASVALSRGPDLAAPLGKGGTWLIDPVDITITSTIPDAITFKGSIADSGSNPYAELIPAGNNPSLYYGTTGYGGLYGKGALYEFNSATDSISLKASFTGPANTGSNGGLPRARLTGPVNGLYYGTAAQGGDNYSGVIYAFNPSTNTISVEASFIGCNTSNACTSSNGANPYSALIAGSHGLYYGTAMEGGSSNVGAIYAFDPTTRTISLKASFDFYTTGAFPYAGLIAADGGKYYGTTRNGGDKDLGAIYAFDPTTSAISLKASFSGSNGANPGTLVPGGKDIYYGSTPYGGQFGKGAIYEFNSVTGTITLKDSFTGSNGAIAGSDLIAAGNGLFYGTTIEGGSNNQGAIYAFDSLSGKISLKASFTGSNGAKPFTALTAAGDGIFYGTTAYGGAIDRGTIYAFDANTYVSTTTIESALNTGGNVVISTSDPLGPAGAGNITVNSHINKTGGGEASLTLNAHNNIVLNSNISSSSAALNLNLNVDIDSNGSGATSLASAASLSLNGGTATANGPISIAANAKIKDAQIVAPAINSDGGILENILSLNVDSLRLNGGSLQANGKATVKALDLSAGSISGSGDLQVTQSFNRSGGTIDGNFSNLSITQVSGSLTPGALRAAGPVTLQAPSGQLTLDAPITASTVLARGSSGVTLSGAAVLTASAPSGRAITLDAGSGAFLNNSTSAAAALSKQPGATWAIYADNPTSTPPANLGGLAYNFKQYNQTFDTNQGSNPILGSGNGLFFANSPAISVNLLPVSKVYDGKVEVNLSASSYNVTGILAGDLVKIKPAVGTYDNKNAGTGKLVSVSGLTIADATESASKVAVFGYNLSSTEASGAIGTITPLPLTGAAIAPGSSIYGSALAPGAVSFGNIVGSDVVDSSASVNTTTVSSSGEPIVGSYSQSASGLTGADAGNYSFSGFTSGPNYTISKLPLTGAEIGSGSSVYGSALAPGAVSFGNIVGSDVVGSSASVLITTLSTSGKPIIGSYSQSASGLTGTDAGNYTFSGFTSGPNYTISKLPLTGAVIGSGSSIYGSALAPGAVSFGNIVGSDVVGSSASVNTSVLSTSLNPIVGTYSQSASALTGVDAWNYSFSGFTSGPNYTISKLPLTGAVIGSGSSIYGSALAPGAVSFDSIVGSDVVGSSASVLTTTLSTSGKPTIGSYSQSASGLTGTDAGNYSFSGFTSGPNYTISKLPLTGAGIASGSSIYGSALAPGAVSFGNIVGSDVVGSSASVNVSTFSSSGKPIVGSYSQSASGLTGADAGNYTFLGFTSGPNYTINKLPLTGADIGSGSSIYGSALASGAVSFGNIVGSDVVGSSASVNTSTLSSSGKPIVGSYSQSASGLTGTDAGNYTFLGFTSGPNYTISKLPLTGAVIGSGSSIYGSALAPGALSFDNIVGSDVVGSSASVNASTLSSNGNPIVGTYSQSASGLTGVDAGNYTFSGFTSGLNYTISKLPLTGAVIASGSSVYGSALASGAVSFGNIVGSDVVGSSASVNASTLSSNGNPIVGTYSQSASGLTGTDAGNYSFSGFTSGPNYTISKLPLTGAVIASGSSIYGSALAPGAVSFGNIVGSDVVASSASVNTSTLSSSGKPIFGTYSQSASGLTGTDAGNYSFLGGFTTATPNYNISKAPLTISAVTDSRVYNGTTSSSAAPTVTSGELFNGDILTGLRQVFDSKDVLGTNQSTLKVSGDYTLSDGNNGNNYAVSLATASGTITPLDLPVTGLVALDKVYDATTVAPLEGSKAAVRPLSGDEVSVGGTAVGAFAEKNVGSGNAVTVSGVTIAGRDAGNYNLLQQTGLAATISKRDLVVTGLFANNKVYDATTVAPLGGSAAVSPLSGDVVTLGGTAAGAFSDKNLGMDKAVTVTGVTIAGRDADNYNLLQQIGLKAIISKADLSLTGLLALDKVYDATTVAPLGGSAAVSPFSGDVVTLGGTAVGSFADKNVAQAKAVSVGGLSLSGNDAGNYNLLPLTNLKAAITPAPLQISASSDSKIYDGTTQSSLVPMITEGGLWGDDRLTGLAQTYESKNALGAGQSKLIVSAYTLSDGNNGSNYVLSFLPGLGTINRASVTPSFVIKSKPYDGNVDAEITSNSLQGGLAGDEVFVVGASAFFDNAYAGDDKLVTITGYTLSGQAANNYQLSLPAATSTASIAMQQEASITIQQDNRALVSNEEPIKIDEVNPAVGLQLSKLSSSTISKSDDIDISNVTQLPPVASRQEVTPSDSMQPQAPSSTTAMSAAQAGSTQSQPTTSATAVSSGSATNQYQESDQRSADDAKTGLGLSNVPTTEAISPARLQLVMQDAASLIRKYPVRMLNP
jgi:uncharacterized repeat protein (TIGR03803 family)